MGSTCQPDLADLVLAERQIVARIEALCRQIDRVDSLDEERRSELYVILEALKHDAKSSEALLSALSRRLAQEGSHA